MRKRICVILISLLTLSVTLSGCAGIKSHYEFESKWANPNKVTFKPIYVDSTTISKSKEVMGKEVSIEAANRVSAGLVMPSDVKSINPTSTNFAGGMIITSPQIEVAGINLSPLARKSDKELLNYLRDHALDYIGNKLPSRIVQKVKNTEIEKVQDIDFPIGEYGINTNAPNELTVFKVEYEVPNIEIKAPEIRNLLTGELLVVLGRSTHDEDRIIRALIYPKPSKTFTSTDNYKLRSWMYKFFITKHPSDKPRKIGVKDLEISINR